MVLREGNFFNTMKVLSARNTYQFPDRWRLTTFILSCALKYRVTPLSHSKTIGERGEPWTTRAAPLVILVSVR